MIIVNVEKAGSLDKAVKFYKKKHQSYGIVRELRERKTFIKISVKKRRIKEKAVFTEFWKRTNSLE